MKPSPVQEGITQSTEDINRTKSQRKGVLTLSSWARRSIFSCLWTSVLLVLSLLSLDWNYASSFPGPLICRWHIMVLLNFHNSVSQFLTVNLIVYIHKYSIGSVSLKNPDSHKNQDPVLPMSVVLCSACSSVPGASPYRLQAWVNESGGSEWEGTHKPNGPESGEQVMEWRSMGPTWDVTQGRSESVDEI